MAKNDL
jgi:hypothetical protein